VTLIDTKLAPQIEFMSEIISPRRNFMDGLNMETVDFLFNKPKKEIGFF